MQCKQMAGMTNADLREILHDRDPHLFFELRGHIVRRQIDDVGEFFQCDRSCKISFQIRGQCIDQFISFGIFGGLIAGDASGNVKQEAVTFC